MLFEEGTFSPQLLEDPRTLEVFQCAIKHASDRVRISDFLIAAIESADASVLSNFSQALKPECAPLDVRDIIEVYNPAAIEPMKFDGRKEKFSLEALTALEQFDAELSDDRDGLLDVALELLLACVLSHIEEEDREYLTILNFEQCAALFREQVKRDWNRESKRSLFHSASGELDSELFSTICWVIMERASIYASELGYHRILPPHCFLALVDERGGITERLVRLQLEPGASFNSVAQIVSESFRIAGRQSGAGGLTDRAFDETTITLLNAAQRVAQMFGNDAIDAADLLLALLEEMPPRLEALLQRSPLNLDVVKMKRQLTVHLQERHAHIGRETQRSLPAELLPSEDLTYLAHKCGLVKAISLLQQEGRREVASDPYDIINRALYRKEKHHVLLTGLRGVGKTTMAREIARRAASGEISFLEHKRFLWVDCQDISPLESKEKLERLLSMMAGQSDIILCLDGLGPLLRSEPKVDNTIILRRALKDSSIHMIGIMSNRDFEELLSTDLELLECVTRVNIEEPEEKIALSIIEQACVELERRYKVAIEERATERALLLSTEYILSERLPAKAIKILRLACEHLDYERTQYGEQRTVVTVSDVIKVVAQLSGVPEKTLAGVVGKADYEKDFAAVVVGQDEAVEAMASELRRIKAGWTDPEKPASVLLFAGLTGVGKTEFAKVVAQYYSASKRLQTYTMANFTEPHSVSGIIGVPPGYVGYDQGGRLINDLNADPYCVFLLDEAEKAHPEVWKPFLNLFDEAWITDTHGVKAYADKAIFILTTNAGSDIIAQMWLAGERDMDKIVEKVKQALLKIQHERSSQPVFSPEFLARIRRVVVFRPLDQNAMEGICRKYLAKLLRAWKEKREKTLVVPDTLIRYIAERSHLENQRSGNKEGGRFVAKLVTELIEDSIQREIGRQEVSYNESDVIEILINQSESPLPAHDRGHPTISVKFRKR